MTCPHQPRVRSASSRAPRRSMTRSASSSSPGRAYIGDRSPPDARQDVRAEAVLDRLDVGRSPLVDLAVEPLAVQVLEGLLAGARSTLLRTALGVDRIDAVGADLSADRACLVAGLGEAHVVGAPQRRHRLALAVAQAHDPELGFRSAGSRGTSCRRRGAWATGPGRARAISRSVSSSAGTFPFVGTLGRRGIGYPVRYPRGPSGDAPGGLEPMSCFVVSCGY